MSCIRCMQTHELVSRNEECLDTFDLQQGLSSKEVLVMLPNVFRFVAAVNFFWYNFNVVNLQLRVEFLKR